MNEKNEQMNKKNGKKEKHSEKKLDPNFRLRMRAPEGTTDVTSGQRPPLWWILRNFRLRMRRTYFRSRDVTSGQMVQFPITQIILRPLSALSLDEGLNSPCD